MPWILGNAIPTTATHVVFVHYQTRKYTLQIERLVNGLIKVGGKEWKYFLGCAAVPPPWPKICFKQIQPEYMFEIEFYDVDGMQFTRGADGVSYLNSCLVNVTVDSFNNLVGFYVINKIS